ncbi:MAG: glutamine amidotransferase PdxT [Candidatus Omnitrophota bacterium]|jgi:glutamine amidotransferase PdxT
MLSLFKPTLILVGITIMLSTTTAHAFDFKSLFKRAGINKESSLASSPMGPAVKEALKVSVDRTINALSQKGGYANNSQINIKMPAQLKILDTTLRRIGLGAQVDAFTQSMNTAAEKATPLARDIFIDAIAEMSINDAQKIISGSNTAATQYLDETSRAQLKAKFEPIILASMSKNQVIARYQGLLDKFKQNPLMSRIPMPRIEPYVANKGLDGLFYTIAQEEVKIRSNPAARTTDLLKQVFTQK